MIHSRDGTDRDHDTAKNPLLYQQARFAHSILRPASQNMSDYAGRSIVLASCKICDEHMADFVEKPAGKHEKEISIVFVAGIV